MAIKKLFRVSFREDGFKDIFTTIDVFESAADKAIVKAARIVKEHKITLYASDVQMLSNTIRE